MIKTVTVEEAYEKKLWEDETICLYQTKEDAELYVQGPVYMIHPPDEKSWHKDKYDIDASDYENSPAGGAMAGDELLYIVPEYSQLLRTVDELEARYEHMRRAFYDTEWQLALEFWASDKNDWDKLHKELDALWVLKDD